MNSQKFSIISMKDNKNYISDFKKKGYFKIEKFFSENFVKKMNNEINLAKNVEKYFDKNRKLRRIEKLFDKGDNLNKLNYKLLEFLSKLFNKNFVIFKDKFNTKPGGGDGFEAHYDGIFIFKKKKQL